MKIDKILVVMAFGIALTACKPTEKNYQAAYETALQKRKEAHQSADDNVGQLNEINGMHSNKIGDDTVYVLETFVKPMDSTIVPESKIGLAISKYSMQTNADRQVADLRASEPEAFVAIDGAGSYYVIVSTCATMEEGIGKIKAFKERHPGYPFIGLPEDAALVTISD